MGKTSAYLNQQAHIHQPTTARQLNKPSNAWPKGHRRLGDIARGDLFRRIRSGGADAQAKRAKIAQFDRLAVAEFLWDEFEERFHRCGDIDGAERGYPGGIP